MNVLKIALRKEGKGDSGKISGYALIALAIRNQATIETFISCVQGEKTKLAPTLGCLLIISIDECLCISDLSSHVERAQLDVLLGEDDVHLYKIITKR